MPKEKKHGRDNKSRDQRISELVAAIVSYYDLKDKVTGKIGLRRCLTLLCKHHGIESAEPTIRKLKEIKDPAERRAVKSANEKAAKRHENVQLLALAECLGIIPTCKGKGVDRLGILTGIATKTALNSEWRSAKPRRMTLFHRPARDSPGVSAGRLGVAPPVPLSPARHMPPPTSAHRPVVTPMARAMTASNSTLLAQAIEIADKGDSWRFGVGPLPTV